MFADNDYYGHRYIFSKYCRTKNSNCFASIQHGILTPPQEKNLGKRSFIFAPFLTWNKRVEENSKKRKIPSVFSVGAPFLYLHKINKKKFKKPRGTLVFPSKSTHNKSRSVNNEELIKIAEKSFRGPYSICVYYLDLNKDWSAFKKRGWKILSCGEKKNKNFLFNFYKYISEHKNIICTSINTAAFYSMYMRKNFKFTMNNFDNPNKKKIVYQNKNDDDLQIKTRIFFEKKYPGFISNKLSNLQRYNLSKIELGFDSIKKPEEIYKILGWDNHLKKVLAKILSFYFMFRIV